MRILLLFISFFTVTTINAQSVVVVGTVVDYNDKPIVNSKVIFNNDKTGFTNSNSSGYYTFKIDLSKTEKIIFTHVGHENKTIFLSKKLERKVENDTLKLNVTLNDLELREVIVGVKKPVVIFGNQDYSVSDFILLSNDRLLLLTYDKTLKKGSHIRLFKNDTIELDSYSILDESIELKSDYRNNVHLITTDNVYLVLIKNNIISLLREDKQYYYKFVAPIVDTLEDRIYYSNYSEIYPAFDYIEFNKTDSVYKSMLKVVDEPMMEQYRAEFKFTGVRTKIWAHNKQIETGIDKEIWVGAAVFTKSVYYTPLYAPLFIKEDSIFVFDHYKDKLLKYVTDKGVVDSVSIDYHFNSKKTGWEQPIIQDKKTEVIYTLYNRNGYTFLSVINSVTGKVVKSQKLFYKYIEQIQIIGDKVYYIYRPYESIQKKYIYSEKITVKAN